MRQVKSYCEDVLYDVHNRKIKITKHFMLKMSLKSLTSSRKIIDIIDRYSHCISYPGVEELETKTKQRRNKDSIQKSKVFPN